MHSGRFLISSSGVHSGKFLISSSSSAQLLTCKCLNFQKIEPQFLNYEFLNMCRVLYLEEGNRETAPVETAPALSASIGMFMPSTAPELRGHRNLAMFLERFLHGLV